VHHLVTKLSRVIVEKFGESSQEALVFPTHNIAERCQAYLHDHAGDSSVRIVCVSAKLTDGDNEPHTIPWTNLHAVSFHPDNVKVARQFWQHTGEGVSSRQAEYCLQFADSFVQDCASHVCTVSSSNVPLSTIAPVSSDATAEKENIRKRIAGLISAEENPITMQDVFLYCSGMMAISDLYRALIHSGPYSKGKFVAYGFLYVDSFKIMDRFAPKDAILYGHANVEELDDLERRLKGGEKVTAVFCEVPGNPLLITPDMERLRALADKYEFVLVCDDTVGTFVNVNVLPYVDVVVTSLTKLFSGACNVMGGSVVVNPKSKHHDRIHDSLTHLHRDIYFPLDAEQMWKNSDNFPERVQATNRNAQAVAERLATHPRVAKVYYPSLSPTKHLYDVCRRPEGGYSYLVTILFKLPAEAVAFFDALDVARGPSLGTNFCLSCPYTLFGHYSELEWVAQFGIDEYLVRISVGAEPHDEVMKKIEVALEAMPKVS